MSDEYLWDGSGEPDPLVAELEDKLGDLQFEPVFVVDEAALAPAPEPAPAPPRRGFLLGSAVTVLAVAAAALLVWWGYRMGRDDAARPVVQPVVLGVPEAVADPPPVEVPQRTPQPEVLSADEDFDEPDGAQPPEVVASLDAIEPTGKGTASGKSKGRAKGKRVSGSTSRPPSSKAASSASSSNSSSSKGGDLDVDCILDPSRCGPSSGKAKGTSKKPAQTGSTDASLPERLSTTDIREGVAPIKGRARACGRKHGAAPGDKVRVKLTIVGSTGTVIKATAQTPYTGTPLGKCLAAAFSGARFRRFQKATLGAVYPITM